MTLDTIAASIREELGVQSSDTRRLPLSVVYSRINRRMRKMSRAYDLPCTLKTNPDVSLTSGQYSYSLPTDFAKPWCVRVKAAGLDPADLMPWAARYAQTEYPDPTDASTWGTASLYAIFGGTMWVFPPNLTAGTLLKIQYYCQFADLTSGSPGNTNALVVALGDALEMLATGDCATFLREPQLAEGYWAEGQSLVDDYLREQKTLVQIDRRPVAEEP